MAPHSRWRWAQPTGTFPKGRARRRYASSRTALAEVAEVTADAMVGLALMWVIMLYGLAVSLLAAATLLDASVHRWLGFAGLAVGVWTGAASLTVALGGSLIPDWLAFVSGIVGGNLWLIGWAALIRRRRSPAQ